MLNLTARMEPNRFSMSFADLTGRKSKLATTGFTNQSFLNSSMHLTSRLPQLNRSLSSSSSQSTKLKLTTLDATLTSLFQEINSLRNDTRESRRHVNFMTEDISERALNQLKTTLQLQVSKMDKAMKISRKNDEERSKGIKGETVRLREKSKGLREMMDNIACRLDGLENVMGMYSAKEKHKI